MTATRGADATPLMWFRQDVRRDLRRVWAWSLSLVVLAMGLFALPLGTREVTAGWQLVGWVLGGASLLAAPLYLIVQLQRILGPEIYLAVLRDGLLWHDEQHERFVRWTQIAAVGPRADGPGVTLVIDGEDDLVLARAFEGIDAEALVRLLAELRQKALLGLPIRPRGPTT